MPNKPAFALSFKCHELQSPDHLLGSLADSPITYKNIPKRLRVYRGAHNKAFLAKRRPLNCWVCFCPCKPMWWGFVLLWSTATFHVQLVPNKIRSFSAKLFSSLSAHLRWKALHLALLNLPSHFSSLYRPI